MYKFGTTSRARLATCHEDIQKILNLAIRRSRVDFMIVCGERSVKEQQRLYAQGRTTPGAIVTKVDGIKVKSEHNHSPSLAVDIAPYINGALSWDLQHLIYLAGVIESVAAELLEVGEVSRALRWGGNWDKDGEILSDQTFDDAPHFELV